MWGTKYTLPKAEHVADDLSVDIVKSVIAHRTPDTGIEHF